MVLDLAEILRAEELLCADDLRTRGRCLFDQLELTCEVAARLFAARHLRDPDTNDARLVRCAGDEIGNATWARAAGATAALAEFAGLKARATGEVFAGLPATPMDRESLQARNGPRDA